MTIEHNQDYDPRLGRSRCFPNCDPFRFRGLSGGSSEILETMEQRRQKIRYQQSEEASAPFDIPPK